ncbi:hypothetical protein I1E95_11840 [Synechococcus sp. CBW1107]|uniref:hypothetical protein n=1 Tax=Synechococcus sp. CBW1107 TaxID=2789857 RepID=UPI0018CD4E5E|nr:hypothetical protein [Synechococcus sp. CBW1107]QPN55840.1 hypothetical protein I1E95_11840 [Synechococcus sp. CBW1107]
MDVELLVSTLRALAKGFFVIYLIVFLRQLLPLDVTSLGWLQGLITVLINNSAIPLGGFGFLLLAALISPTARTVRLLLFASRWALPAALGFLLLIPLQGYVAYKALAQVESTANRQSAVANDQLATLGKQISAATTPEDLNSAIKDLPPPVIERTGSLPLSQAQEELLAGIEQERTTLRARKSQQMRGVRWSAAKEAIGNSLAALVLARVLYTGRLRRLWVIFSSPFPAEET